MTNQFETGQRVTIHPTGEHGRTPEHGVVLGRNENGNVIVKHAGGGTSTWNPDSLKEIR